MTSTVMAGVIEAAADAVQAVLAAELAAVELLEELLHAYFADNPAGECRAPLEEALGLLFESGVRGWYDDDSDRAT